VQHAGASTSNSKPIGSSVRNKPYQIVTYTVESALKVSIRNFMNLSFVHTSEQEVYSLYMAAFPGD